MSETTRMIFKKNSFVQRWPIELLAVAMWNETVIFMYYKQKPNDIRRKQKDRGKRLVKASGNNEWDSECEMKDET